MAMALVKRELVWRVWMLNHNDNLSPKLKPQAQVNQTIINLSFFLTPMQAALIHYSWGQYSDNSNLIVYHLIGF